MSSAGAGPDSAWPLLAYAAVVLFLIAAIIALSFVLGERHRERDAAGPFESGVPATGTARLRFSVRFYLMAVFFVIFDLEAAFLFAWAVAFRRLGWGAYLGVLVFGLTLLLMIFYLGRTGALDFVSRPGALSASHPESGVSGESS